MLLIGTCKHKGHEYIVERDREGKFYIKNDSIVTQKELNSLEVICWLLNAMNDEV